MAQIKNPAAIKLNRLFSGIPDVRFNFKDKNYLEVKEGEVIYSKGDKSEYIYLVLNGRIKFKIYENPRQPKVFLVSKNEFFGEKELIDKTLRNSSALAEKNSLLYKLGYKDFFKLSAEYRKMLNNLNEKKYEEVVPPSRKAELKEDIYKRIISGSDSVEQKENRIELKDYSYENPLLELKAQDEINDELKIYQEEDDSKSSDEDNLIVDDSDIRWELLEEEEPETHKEENLITDEEQDYTSETGETTLEIEEAPENIVDNFKKIQDQVNIFRESLNETEEAEEEISPPVEPLRIQETLPNTSFIKAIEKLSSVMNEEEAPGIIVEACTELVNAERGIIYFPDLNNVLKGKLLEDDTEVVAGTDTIPGRCLRESQIINIRDVFNDTDFNPSVDYVSYFHIHSLICIPIPEEGQIKAVLQLFNSRDGEFSQDDEEALKSITPVLYKTLERTERFGKELKSKENKIAEAENKIAETETKIAEAETKIAEVVKVEEKKLPPAESAVSEKSISLKVLADFLHQEFQVIVRDIKQFNNYLQRIDIPGEAKEISDIVTSQTSKIIDLIDVLKIYGDKTYTLPPEKESYISIFNDMVSLLAEYTEGRKVNLYKRFDSDAMIAAEPKFLYLAIFQLVKYQCDMMPFGGNIFISSEKLANKIEVTLRNATRKTDESFVINSEFEFNENSASGLGLSLSKRIIEDHKAEINIKNQSGTGLEISIRFPILF